VLWTVVTDLRCFVVVSSDCNAGVYVPAPVERVHTVQTWLYELLFDRMNEGGIGTEKDSSTRARLQAFLSEAMLGFEQCKCALRDPYLHSLWRSCTV
jgi:hypothetical protein